MGLFRGLTVVLIGFLAISLLKKRDSFKNVPVIGQLLHDNIDKYKEEIVVLMIAFIFVLI
jgi:hypothetical protein